MSRTFRSTHKNTKIIKPDVAAIDFSWNYYRYDRSPNRSKYGAVFLDDGRWKHCIIVGKFQRSAPKYYRKRFNKKQKLKMNQKMFRDIRNEDYDFIGGEKLVKNAGYYYF